MTDVTSGGAGRGWTIGLWVVQILLAAFYLYAGINKLTQPVEVLGAMNMAFALVVPEWLTRFIGLAETLGAIGLILPALTRILPRLTPLASPTVGHTPLPAMADSVLGAFGFARFKSTAPPPRKPTATRPTVPASGTTDSARPSTPTCATSSRLPASSSSTARPASSSAAYKREPLVAKAWGNPGNGTCLRKRGAPPASSYRDSS